MIFAPKLTLSITEHFSNFLIQCSGLFNSNIYKRLFQWNFGYPRSWQKKKIILNCNPLCVIYNIMLLFQWPWTLKKFCWQTNPFWLRSFVCVRLEWLWLWNINYGNTKLGWFLPKSDRIEGKSELEQLILSF